jgi:hypothetical protein
MPHPRLLFPTGDRTINADPLLHPVIREAVEILERVIRINHHERPTINDLVKYHRLLGQLVTQVPLVETTRPVPGPPRPATDEAWALNLEALSRWRFDDAVEKISYDLPSAVVIDNQRILGTKDEQELTAAILLVRDASDFRATGQDGRADLYEQMARVTAAFLGIDYPCTLTPAVARESRGELSQADKWWAAIKYLGYHSHFRASRD